METDAMDDREALTGTAGVMAGGPAGALGGGAFAAVTGMTVGWVVGFLIGLMAGMAIGESRGIYRGMQHGSGMQHGMSAAALEASRNGRRGLGLLGSALTAARLLALLSAKPWRTPSSRGNGVAARFVRPGRGVDLPFRIR